MSEKPDGPAMQVNFRMPLGLKDMLQKAADSAGRSLTQEINLRLLDSFSFIHIPAEMRKRLHTEAEKNGWSLDREIVGRLHDSFAPRTSSDEFYEAAGRLLHQAATELRADFAQERRVMWQAMQELADIAGDRLDADQRERLARTAKLMEDQEKQTPVEGD